jgi:hypothetical protein
VPSAGAPSTELAQAILSLPSQTLPTGLLFDDARLFAGIIDATITNQTGELDDFAGADVIAFRVVRRDGTAPPAGIGFTSPFVGTRAEFEQWPATTPGRCCASSFREDCPPARPGARRACTRSNCG